MSYVVSWDNELCSSDTLSLAIYHTSSEKHQPKEWSTVITGSIVSSTKCWYLSCSSLCQNFNRKFINGHSCVCAVKIWLKIALNAVRLPKFEPVNGILWSPRTIMVKDLRQRSRLAWFCACAESCVVFNTGPYTVLPDNSILITANMQSETCFPSSH